nr:immunoglobulin light chain junction region [Macaca mulatta]
CLQHIGHPFTF